MLTASAQKSLIAIVRQSLKAAVTGVDYMPAQPQEQELLAHCGIFVTYKTAGELHSKYYCLFRDLFVESNPIPVKAAMAMKGMIEEVYRLPLCTISDGARQVLTNAMRKSGLL